MSRSKTLWISLLVAALATIASAVQIHQESFETTTGWSVTPAFAISGTVGDYMDRFDNTTITVPLATLRGSLDGTMFIGGEDTNGSLPLPADGVYTVTLDAVDVTGYTTLTVSIALNGNPVDAYDTGSLGNGDYLRVFVDIDGGGDVLVGQFTRVGPTALSNGRLGQDTNLDGFGDVEIPDYNNFNNYTFAVPGSGSSMVIKVVTRFESGNEEIVYDNIRVDGGSSDITPPDLVSVNLIGNTTLELFFSEDVEEASAEDPFGYSVNGGVGNPLSVTRDGVDFTKCTAVFNPMSGGDYTITVNDVEDMAGNPCVNETGSFSVIPDPTAGYGDVVITEIMYDDTASTDVEWVEVHNTTAAAIDMSGWVLNDDSAYPADGTEGGIRVPDGTTISADGYVILSRESIPELTDEVVCAHYVTSWILGNGGDNLALYTWHIGGVLVDGIVSNTSSDFYPDLAGTNEGNSIEKCDPNSSWTGDPSAWTESLVFYSSEGNYRHCTPGYSGFCCSPDDADLATVSVVVSGPPVWGYNLSVVSGCIDKLVFTNFCEGTTGSVDGDALNAGWTVVADDGDGDSVIFVAATPLHDGGLDGFQLNHPFCSDNVFWGAGESGGSVEGPLPVELLGFTAIGADNSIVLRWSTASELENDHFDVLRDGNVAYRVDGLGTSAIGASYEWMDTHVSNGTTYIYTLVAVRTDGTREEIGTVSATPTSNTAVITEYALHQNYPNPFNPETNIMFDLLESGYTTLRVFNAMGQEVTTLVSSDLSAGRHTVMLNGSNLTSGIYFYRLESGSFTAQQKMLLIK